MPPISNSGGIGGSSATSSGAGGTGTGTDDVMGQMAGLFGNLFGGAGGGQPQQQPQGPMPGQQQFGRSDFVGIDAAVAQTPPGAYSHLNEPQRARNPTGYAGVFDEVQRQGQGMTQPPMPMQAPMQSDFNPYVFAGIQPPPRQEPIPNTNINVNPNSTIDPVSSQYAKMMNTSCLNMGMASPRSGLLEPFALS